VLTLTVNAEGSNPPVIQTYVLMGAVSGTPYSDTIVATGSNITWSIASGNISPLTLNTSTGQITGTPGSTGRLSATFQATNSFGSNQQSLPIDVIAAGSGAPAYFSNMPASIDFRAGYPNQYFGRPYSNAAGPHIYEFSVNSGTIPSWLNFLNRGGDGDNGAPSGQKAGSSGMTLWGTPPANTTSSTILTFNLTNTILPNPSASGNVTINVVAPENIQPTTLSRTIPAAKAGVAYSNQLYAVGVPDTFTWTLTSGNKPSWLTISSSGLMTGTPSSGDVGSLIFTFSCSNGIGTVNTGNLGFEVKSSSSKVLISPSDFTYLGYYDTSFNGLDAPYTQGLAVRRVGSEVRLITKFLGGDSFAEFSLSGKTLATSGSPSSCQITATTRTWTNAGTIPVGGDTPYLLWDEAGSKIFCNWALLYPDDGADVRTKIYTATLTDGSPTGTVTNAKRLMLDGVPDRRAGTGFLSVPSSFQSAYGTGPFAVGLGGSFSRAGALGQIAVGLSMYGIPDPAGYPNDTTLSTSQYKIYAVRDNTAEFRGRKLENTINYLTDGAWLQSVQGPDNLGMWAYGDRYVGGTWISGASKEGVIVVGYFAADRVWYETSTGFFGGMVAEAHIYDPADLGRISQGIQNDRIDPIVPNIRSLSETRRSFENNWYQALEGQQASCATYDEVGKVLYVQVNGAGPTNFWNRIYAYSVDV
jgi:hypothetical protein